MEFSTATFEMIEKFIYPIVKGLTGFDAQAWTGDKSELFILVGDGLSDLATLFTMVGTALEDGLLTAEEIEAIITDAKTLPEALAKIEAFFDDEPTV